MKKVTIIFVLLFCLSLALPLPGKAGGYHHGGGGCDGDYWVPAAIIGGTILAGALFIGAMSRPPAPPQPAYRPTDTSQPYAAPDPNFITRYGEPPTPSQRQTGGEWVVVPSQQVGGTWVPTHRVFVPNG
ncbi:MAG: hypothetical protein H6Q52_1154 [Deltaproteobacteria bacterium]|nr:hypothetical protein [Deltaproteobacteria bacterium]